MRKRKSKKKNTDVVKNKTSRKAEPLDDWFIEVMRFSSKLSCITDYLGDNESVTVESMKRRKLTKEELVEDMEHIWDRISKARQESRQLRRHFKKFQPETLKDISITLDRLRSPIDRALWEFGDLNWPDDKERFYKHTQRAYKRANEYRHRLELLSSKLADDAESEFAGKEESKDIKEEKPPCKINDIKNRFVFAPGQVLFDDKDLELPAGMTVMVMKKLIENFGRSCLYNRLDPENSKPNLSPQLKRSIVDIRKSLKNKRIPCLVKTKTNEGYLITHR